MDTIYKQLYFVVIVLKMLKRYYEAKSQPGQYNLWVLLMFILHGVVPG